MNAKIFITGWLALSAWCVQGGINQPSDGFSPWGSARPFPPGLEVNLVSDRTNYFLGENILLHYRIANASDETFKISVGGDYRGSSRADRFKVTATSADGKPVADPTPFMQNFGGGMMPGGEIKPGVDWFEKIYVLEYCRFDAPGTYTIRAFHDLGFGPKGTNDSREVALTIHLSAPSEAEARRILAEAEKAGPDNGTTWGTKGVAHLDYHCIRWPTFLKPLQERAQAGSEQALEGVSSIRTLEASRALVQLLSHANGTLAAKAAGYLEVRLPHSTNEFEGPWGNQRKQFIIENAWEGQLNPLVRDYCLRLLANRKRPDFQLAASLLRRAGTAHEAPALMAAVEFVVAQTNAEYMDDIRYPSPVRIGDALIGAALSCDPAMDVLPGAIRSPGEALLFLTKHGGSERALSKEEATEFVRLAGDRLPYIRMKAIENLPKEVTASLASAVAERMEDPVPGVRTFAFEAARRMNEPKHRDVALAILKTADDEWLQNGASDIALKYGARYECAMVWASRFVAPKNINDYTPHHVLQHLFEITVGSGVGGSLTIPHNDDEARALRQRWESFLTRNRSRIENGSKFAIAELPADLGVKASSTPGVSAGY